MEQKSKIKKCKRCEKEFKPQNPKGKFCSDKCRVYWNREKGDKKTKEDPKKDSDKKTEISSELMERFKLIKQQLKDKKDGK